MSNIEHIRQRNRAARSRRVTTMRRSLRLVTEAASQHMGLLDSDPPQLPESSFLIHELKYDQALGEARLVDMLAGGTEMPGDEPADDGTVTVSRDDLLLLTRVVRAWFPSTGQDTPLDRLETAAGVPYKPAGPVPGPAAQVVPEPAESPGQPEDLPDEVIAGIAAEALARFPVAVSGPCPSCGSPDPRWHPSAGDGGEVTTICPDPFHAPVPDEVRAAVSPVPEDQS